MRDAIILRIKDSRFGDKVAQVISKNIQNRSQGLARLVIYQAFDVLEKESFRLMPLDDLSDVKEKGPTGVFEATSFACDRECLAGEARTQHIKFLGNRGFSFLFCDIAVRDVSEVLEIRLLCLFLPFRGKDAAPSQFLEGHPETADAREEIDESKIKLTVLIGPESRPFPFTQIKLGFFFKQQINY